MKFDQRLGAGVRWLARFSNLANLISLARSGAPYALLALLPVLLVIWVGGDGSWPHTHEGFRYIALAEHFGQAFANGQWYPRWLPELNGGYGYPTFVYYQPLVFYLWLPFRLLAGDPTLGMWLTIVFMLALGAMACYRLAAQTGGPILGLFAGVLFLLSPYVFVNWLARGDLSEMLALCLVPWALHFLRRADDAWLVRANLSRPLLGLAFTTAGIFMAHPISGLLFGPSLVVIAITLALRESPQRIDLGLLGRLALAGLAAIGLATPYWHPLLTLKSAVNLDAAAGGYFDPTLHTVHWQQIFGGPWGFAGSAAGTAQDNMSFEVGGLQLAVALTGAVVGWQSRFVRGVFAALVLSIVAMTPTATALWRLPVFEQMQFPWRLLSLIVGLQAALIVGWTFTRVPATPPRRLALLLGLLVLATGWRPEQFTLRARKPEVRKTVADSVKTARHSRETFAARNEFLPKTARKPPVAPLGDRPLLEIPRATVTPRPEHGFHHILADVQLKSPTVAVINQLYFPGWSVSAGGHDFSDEELLAALTEDGRLRVPLDPARGDKQLLEARYAGPPGALVRWLGVLLGAACLLALRPLDRRARGLVRMPARPRRHEEPPDISI